MDDKQKHKFWMNQVKKSKKLHPEKLWKEAENRLNCKTSKESPGKPYINNFRLHYDSLKSFMDQIDPNFKISPTKAYMDDDTALKQAECDSIYLEYVWLEQKCQIAESKKLDSVLLRNVGTTLVEFDVKKWMPKLKYVPARKTGFDSDSEGDLSKNKFRWYEESVSLEDFKAKYEVTDEELLRVKNAGGSSLTEKEIQENPDDTEAYITVVLYYIFAKGSYAVTEQAEEGELEIPSESVLEELNMSTPRKYMVFVKGLDRPLVDEDWLYDLDDDEFPLTVMMFNTPSESDYGFTDYQQMERTDILGDNIFLDMQSASMWMGRRKFGGGPSAEDLTEKDINAWLNDPYKAYHAKMIGSDGKLKIQEVTLGQPANDLVNMHDTVDQATRTASGLAEILSSDATQYKDVTAIAARLHYDNAHQRVNRRLGGPEGYEASIAEDAVKMLEIAHQMVPKYSLVERFATIQVYDIDTEEIATETSQEKEYVSLPWQDTILELRNPDSRLIKLGVDAIVGPELAPFWRTADEYPSRVFKLATKVKVLPGSTRSITKEHQAALLKQYYNEVMFPFYQATNAWDKAKIFIEKILRLAGVDNIDDVMPDNEQIQQFQQAQEQEMAQEGGQTQALSLEGE